MRGQKRRRRKRSSSLTRSRSPFSDSSRTSRAWLSIAESTSEEGTSAKETKIPGEDEEEGAPLLKLMMASKKQGKNTTDNTDILLAERQKFRQQPAEVGGRRRVPFGSGRQHSIIIQPPKREGDKGEKPTTQRDTRAQKRRKPLYCDPQLSLEFSLSLPSPSTITMHACVRICTLYCRCLLTQD